MEYSIILAGGSGTRFWPLSRRGEPKQFLNLCSDKPMLELTLSRLRRLVSPDRIYIATNAMYRHQVQSCGKRLAVSWRNILFEPQAKNTLAPIAVLTKKIYERDKEAIIMVLPSDHYITQERTFLGILTNAVHAARKGYIVTLGITPEKQIEELRCKRK